MLKSWHMKKIHWWYFIFPVIFLALSTLILVEGATPGNDSSRQSSFFASLFDHGPKKATIINPESLTLDGKDILFVSDSNTYTVSFNPIDTSDQRVAYEVLDEDKTVLSSGNVLTGLKEGEVTLVATSLANQNLKAEKKIKVMREPINLLEVTLDSYSILKNCTSKLSIQSNPKDFTLEDVEFEIADTNIISIDTDGYLHALEVGSTSFEVVSKANGVRSNKVEVTIHGGSYVPTTMMDYEENLELYVGEKKDINPIFNLNASDTNYKLSSLDKNIRINNNQLSATKEGTFDASLVSIANTSLTKTIHIQAKEVKAKEIQVSFEPLKYGITTSLNYTLIPEMEGLMVTHPEVTFTSSDSSIATIDEKGNMIGLRKGNVDITVTWKEDETITGLASISIISLDTNTFNNINHWVRKLIGHFGVFLVTAVFGILSIYFFFFDEGKKKYILSSVVLVFGLILAMLSELLQIDAGNRGPSWNDVGIDFSGYALGAFLTFVIVFFVYRKLKIKKQNNEKSNEIQ